MVLPLKVFSKPAQKIFVGATNVIDPHVETAEEVRDMIPEAAETIPWEQSGTTDDCAFSLFVDDTSTARETASAKITARLKVKALAEQKLSKN